VKTLLVFQQGGQVVKENSRLAVIPHFADHFYDLTTLLKDKQGFSTR